MKNIISLTTLLLFTINAHALEGWVLLDHYPSIYSEDGKWYQSQLQEDLVLLDENGIQDQLSSGATTGNQNGQPVDLAPDVFNSSRMTIQQTGGGTGIIDFLDGEVCGFGPNREVLANSTYVYTKNNANSSNFLIQTPQAPITLTLVFQTEATGTYQLNYAGQNSSGAFTISNLFKAKDQSWFLPVSKTCLAAGSVILKVDGNPYFAEMIDDGRGGLWFKLPQAVVENSNLIEVDYLRQATESLLPFRNYQDAHSQLLANSEFIDSTNESIVAKAQELYNAELSVADNAKAIQSFVISHVELRVETPASFLLKASETLSMGYGTCMNFSRLYVALCRAAGIPSRTVWGIVHGLYGEQIYDFHHQWAEILDEQGTWHAMDFGYSTDFDLNDIRYLDLIYAPEENPLIKITHWNCVKIGDNIEFIHDYPSPLTGRIGFSVVNDNRPQNITLRYTAKNTPLAQSSP
ncbi:MAG: transglutaminase-like domain-containing protein [Opitutales bacterium]|nr:transglutaminase-like domain-containing protein [Opitutales bacterium]